MHNDPVIVLLTIDGEIIETTPEHPFRTVSGNWVASGNLQAGDQVQKADSSYGIVEAVKFVYQLQPMYNLTVATAHTFFVGDGQWLVHNNCGPEWTRKMLSQSQVIKRGTGIRDVNRLVRTYGGDAKKWVKKKGWDANGVEWHWYEHTGIGRFEPKIKY